MTNHVTWPVAGRETDSSSRVTGPPAQCRTGAELLDSMLRQPRRLLRLARRSQPYSAGGWPSVRQIGTSS